MLTAQTQLAVEAWLQHPLQARALAGIIEDALKGIPSNNLLFYEWLPWVYSKTGNHDGVTDLLECVQVLRGGSWVLDLAAGLRGKKKGLTTHDKHVQGWLNLMRRVAREYATHDPAYEVTTDPLRRWTDLHDVHPYHCNHWGRVFSQTSGFEFTGKLIKSTYPSNHGRDIKVWRLKMAQSRPHLFVV